MNKLPGFSFFVLTAILACPLSLSASTAAGQSDQASGQSGVASGAGAAASAHGSASVIIPVSAAVAVPVWMAGSGSAVAGISLALVGVGSAEMAEGIWDVTSGPPAERPALDATICRPPQPSPESKPNAEGAAADPDPRKQMQQSKPQPDRSPAEMMQGQN